MTNDVEKAVALLSAHREIEQKIYRMGYALEQGDFAEVGRLLRHATFGADRIGREVFTGEDEIRAQYARTNRTYPGQGRATREMYTNVLVDIDLDAGTAASTTAYTVAQQVPGTGPAVRAPGRRALRGSMGAHRRRVALDRSLHRRAVQERPRRAHAHRHAAVQLSVTESVIGLRQLLQVLQHALGEREQRGRVEPSGEANRLGLGLELDDCLARGCRHRSTRRRRDPSWPSPCATTPCSACSRRASPRRGSRGHCCPRSRPSPATGRDSSTSRPDPCSRPGVGHGPERAGCRGGSACMVGGRLGRHRRICSGRRSEVCRRGPWLRPRSPHFVVPWNRPLAPRRHE